MIITKGARLLLAGLNDDSRRVVLAEAAAQARGGDVTTSHVEQALASLGRNTEKPTKPLRRR